MPSVPGWSCPGNRRDQIEPGRPVAGWRDADAAYRQVDPGGGLALVERSPVEIIATGGRRGWVTIGNSESPEAMPRRSAIEAGAATPATRRLRTEVRRAPSSPGMEK
ncbi:MAG: hypothetical protein IPN78_16600 [Candidatus Accumulibacter sp.]|nr:hypothetical protein [Candidatus Accumulibacter propinquus]